VKIDVEVNGVKKKVVSPYKTAQTISKGLKQAMLDFPKEELKKFENIMNESKRVLQGVKDGNAKDMADFPGIKQADMIKLSSALGAIWVFCNTMINYFDLDKGLEPKRKDLAEKVARLKIVEDELAVLNAKYEKLVREVETLVANLKDAVDELDLLERTMNKYIFQLNTAEGLTEGLKNEKKTWADASVKYNGLIKNVEGDVLIACGVLSYLGAFSKNFRDDEVKKWKEMLKKENILFSEEGCLRITLGDPIMIQSWTKAELPTDEFTVENTVIMFSTDKFTLSIDPQNQANSFIQKM